jgi:hypothetical protein
MLPSWPLPPPFGQTSRKRLVGIYHPPSKKANNIDLIKK